MQFQSLTLVLVVTLAGCEAPGPHFRGLPATRVTIEGSTFDVRVQPRLAEAIRINVEYAPRLGPIAGRAKMAMEQVSGCTVTEVRGDAAVTTGMLACPNGQSAPTWVPGQVWECVALPNISLSGAALSFPDLECEQVL